MYGSKNDTKTLKKSRQLLKELYAKIPETKGCLENINKENGCMGWCCSCQTPQVLYSEFLNTWNYVVHNCDNDKILNLIGRCLRSYLFGNKEKACVFWDKETKLCSQHETRCYNCRIYGITPEEEFKPRYERLKVIYPDIKPQCTLVKTESGKEVTKQDIDKWWEYLKFIEMSIGISRDLIHDDIDGSYRTYHDHILIHVLGDDGMEYLSKVRQTNDLLIKENVYKDVMSSMVKFLREAILDGKLSTKS